MIKVLVCGGRNFGNRALLYSIMDHHHREAGAFEYLIHGAARGADTLAGEWARERAVPVHSFPADWHTHGNSAGPIRNALMIAQGKPDLVIAFPGGAGTANMIRQAEVAKIPVRLY